MLTLRLKNGALCRLDDSGRWQAEGRSANLDALRRGWLRAMRTETQTIPSSVNVTAREGERRGYWTVVAYEPMPEEIY